MCMQKGRSKPQASRALSSATGLSRTLRSSKRSEPLQLPPSRFILIVIVVSIIVPQPARLGSVQILVIAPRALLTAVSAVVQVEQTGAGGFAHLHKVLVECVLLAPVLETLLALDIALLAVCEIEAGESPTHAGEDAKGNEDIGVCTEVMWSCRGDDAFAFW